MRLEIYCETKEELSPIAFAKAAIDLPFTDKDLREIAAYLAIYAENHPTEKGGAE